MQLRKLRPKTVKVLQAIKPYVNAKGYLDHQAMDAADPGWRKRFSPTAIRTMLNAYRSRGTLHAYLDTLEAQPANGNGHHHGEAVATHKKTESVIAHAERDREVEKLVNERLADIVASCRFCPKCGKDLFTLLHAANMEVGGK